MNQCSFLPIKIKCLPIKLFYTYDPYLFIYTQGEAAEALFAIKYHTPIQETGTETMWTLDIKNLPSIEYRSVDNHARGFPRMELVNDLEKTC